MKRLLAPAALLLLLAASACTTTTDNTNTGAGNTNANANANAAATATPAAAGPTQADIEAKERQVWDALKAKNWDGVSGMLADEFVIVDSEGAEAKAQMMESIKKYDLTEYTFSDIKFIKVDADLAVITYTASEKSTYDGHATPTKPKRASSAWANRGGKWLAVYHQESEVAEMPAATTSPSPAASASPAASPSTTASPAASPAPAPASATDAEKAVWEAIKAKNSDAFMSYLLPDALEVEPEGVLDKTASAKMITGFDASKWALSDFKETKLDEDATLITYKAAGPDRGKQVVMYNASIWTNRGGQWKAAFHQGTYAGHGGM